MNSILPISGLEDLTQARVVLQQGGRQVHAPIDGVGLLTTADATATYQPLDTDLTAIAALSPADGAVMIGNGSAWTADTTPTLTGLLTVNGQIAFPSTQNASSDANTLDDYEEGTFTPTVVGTGTAGAGTYTTQQGRYTKIGRQVFFEISLAWTAHTGTTNMNISGLPFTAAATHNTIVSSGYSAITFTGTNVSARVLASSTTVQPIQFSSGVTYTAIAIDTAGQIDVAGCYVV